MARQQDSSRPSSGTPARSAPPSRERPGRPSPLGPTGLWGEDLIAEIMAGTEENPVELLRTLDRKGISAPTYAVLRTLLATRELLPLRQLLEPTPQESGKVDLLLEAVERVLDSQQQILARLDAIERRITASG